MSALRNVARAQALIAVIAANALVLLGCAELDKLLKGPNANKPVAAATAPVETPAATPTAVAKGTPPPSLLNKSTLMGEIKGAKASTIAPIEKALNDITPQDERALGQATSFHIISKNGGMLLDERLMTYVNEVGNLVAQQGTRQPTKTGKTRTQARRFFFGVVASTDVNAYAAPGGFIFVTRGLLEGLTSESDLAWVLGHEIAHVDYEDGLTGLKAQAVVEGSGFFGRPVEGASTLENQEFFAKLVGKLATYIGNGRFGAKDEERADEVGLQSAIKAGYDPRGAERAINSLSSKSRRGFGAHADPELRLRRLSTTIEAAKTGGKLGVERFDAECIQRLEASLVAQGPDSAAPEEASAP